MTDWPTIHENGVRQFRAAWADPHAHAWDVSSTTRSGSYSRCCATASARPSGGRSSRGRRCCCPIYASRSCAGAGRRPLTWEAVDLLELSPEGRILLRQPYFDPLPPTTTLLRHPRTWLRWWRTGAGPTDRRRRILPPVPGQFGSAGSMATGVDVRCGTARLALRSGLGRLRGGWLGGWLGGG